MSRLFLIQFMAVISIFLPQAVSAKATPLYDLNYFLSYSEINQKCLSIKSEIKGNPEGTLFLKLPKNITQLHFRGKPHLKVIPTDKEDICEVRHEPNDVISVNYQYCINNNARNIDFPIIENDFFHFLVGQVFVTPYSDNEKCLKEIRVNTALPDGFRLASSYTIDQTELNLAQSIKDFSNIVIIGSKNKIETFNIKNQPIYLVTKGDWSFFKNNDLIKYLEKIITVQRQFWNDYDFPHYIVALVQQQVPDHEKYIIRTHKTNVLTMSIPDGPIEKLPKVLWGLSHELFHAWLGLKIKIPEPQGQLQWFFEGVNDYYSLRLAFDCGLITINDYVDFYNSIIKSYSVSPFKNNTNTENAAYYSLRGPHNQLSQMKGHLVFKEFSSKIQNKSNPFDTAMANIFDEFVKKKNYPVTEEKLETIFVKHIGKESWAELKTYLISGKSLDISPNLFKENAQLITEDIETPAFGFDVHSLVKSKKITALDSHSRAYQAGLRNDHLVLNYFLDFDDATAPAVILVEDHSKQKLIKFIPEKTVQTIPKYQALKNSK